jgi:hypothetical protein
LRSHQHESRPRFLDALLLRLSERRLVDGFPVATTEDDAKAEQSFARVEEALRLIRDYAPRRYARIRRDLACVWVRVLPGPWASYNRGLRACQLDSRFVLDQAVLSSQVAASIVHEATHARLTACGIGYEEAIRTRVEALCLHAEDEFAKQLPDGSAIQRVAERTLQRGSAPWTDEAVRQSHLRGSREALEFLRFPSWLGRCLEVLSRLVGRARRLLRAA